MITKLLLLGVKIELVLQKMFNRLRKENSSVGFGIIVSEALERMKLRDVMLEEDESLADELTTTSNGEDIDDVVKNVPESDIKDASVVALDKKNNNLEQDEAYAGDEVDNDEDNSIDIDPKFD